MIITKLAASAAERAVWLVADFFMPKEFFARAHAAIWLCAMYAFFGVLTRLNTNRLVDPAGFLLATGFSRIATRHFRLKLLRSDFYVRCCGAA